MGNPRRKIFGIDPKLTVVLQMKGSMPYINAPLLILIINKKG
jgi:hypothetical protein